MANSTLLDLITKPLAKKIAMSIVTAVIGAAVAYLVDRGLLSGQGADTFTNSLLAIAAGVVEAIFGGGPSQSAEVLGALFLAPCASGVGVAPSRPAITIEACPSLRDQASHALRAWLFSPVVAKSLKREKANLPGPSGVSLAGCVASSNNDTPPGQLRVGSPFPFLGGAGYRENRLRLVVVQTVAARLRQASAFWCKRWHVPRRFASKRGQ